MARVDVFGVRRDGGDDALDHPRGHHLPPQLLAHLFEGQPFPRQALLQRRLADVVDEAGDRRLDFLVRDGDALTRGGLIDQQQLDAHIENPATGLGKRFLPRR